MSGRAALPAVLSALLAAALPAEAWVLDAIDPSARSAARGSASTASGEDAWALFGNPAALAGLGSRQAILTHAAWLEDSVFQSAGVAAPAGRWTAGAGILRLSHGEMEGRDAERRPTGTFSAEEQSFVAGLARRSGPWGAGASVKLLRDRIGAASASEGAADLGATLAPAGSAVTWGAAVRGLRSGGEGLSRSTLSAGASLKAAGIGRLNVDVHRSMDGRTLDVRLGLEHWVMDTLALRAGYLPATERGASSAWRAGLGLRRGAFQFDYALVPARDLGITQRMSLSCGF